MAAGDLSSGCVEFFWPLVAYSFKHLENNKSRDRKQARSYSPTEPVLLLSCQLINKQDERHPHEQKDELGHLPSSVEKFRWSIPRR